MQRVLAEHRSYAMAYMDDVVCSTTWEDHLVHVGGVLQALSSAGLTANPTKCRWGGRAVEFLGHWVGAGTMSVPMHKTEGPKSFHWVDQLLQALYRELSTRDSHSDSNDN